MAPVVTDLDAGRDSYVRGRWLRAYESLAAADRAGELAAADLELLGRSAYMLGRDEDYVDALERAHRAYLEAGLHPPAARCAWWIGHSLLFRGEAGPASGWFARGRRLLDQDAVDCAERGYVLLASVIERVMGGDHAAALDVATEIVAIAERHRDDDLLAMGTMEQGHALVRQGRPREGWRLVDETMVAVTAGDLSAMVAGIVYCNTIGLCHRFFELRRAREWTAALTRWCARQNDMVAHNGVCLVHRAQLMTLGGTWPDALAELDRLAQRFTDGVLNRRALGEAAYQQGEVHRLRGHFEPAQAAYLEAARLGREPQPGLALLRLAQGSRDAAAASIRRAIIENPQPVRRAPLLPAYVEIMVAVGDLDAAAAATSELEAIAARHGGEMLEAMAAGSRGETRLATGEPEPALVSLRRAWRLWQDLGAQHEAARARALLGLACRELGDHDAASSELEMARDVFSALGAGPAAEWAASLLGDGGGSDRHGLTERELEVLRLVAAGNSNREIAAALVISERTVARHLQNIFAKLRVSSRTAAGAFAFENGLV